MDTTDIQALEARQKFGELLERVYYQHANYRISRKNKPMARLVDEAFMVAIEKLIESDTALADTLALMLNEEAMQIIEQGTKEIKEGKLIPIEEVLR